jgi:ABC-type branched-subunit amino acid transport system substrate-binding protein
LLFPFTGAQPQREFPYDELAFNLRASYRQETAGLVQNFLASGRTRIAIFYQIDAYGRSGWDGVKRELARHNKKIVAEATYGRGTGYGARFDTQVEILKAADPQAVIAVGAYAACGGFIRDTRLKGWDVPIANLSFVDSASMIDLLKASEEALGVELTHNLVNSQVVPSHEDVSLKAVREYREMMQRYDPVVPTALRSTGYRPKRFSPVSFEGFLNAKMLVEILRRMGADIDRRRLKPVIESIDSYDIGIDVPVRFGPQRQQGLDAVYYTTVRDGHSVPLENGFDWSR